MMNISQIAWNYYKNQILKNPQKDYSRAGSLILIVTSKCNFKCRHCLRDFSQARDLSFEIAQKAIEGAKKYNFKLVGLTGGEPLLYPDFKPLIEFIVANGYMFSLVTNGLNFKQFAPLFKKHRDKISFIAFSLESTDRKQHDFMRQKGSFDALLEDFQICRESKIPFRTVTAVSTMNYEQIFDIALFAKKKGAKSLAMTTVLPCPRSEDNQFVLNAKQREELFFSLRGLTKIIKLPIFISADIHALNNLRLCNPLDMLDVSIDMDGNIVQCCELANFDSPAVTRRAIVTSLADQSFDDAFKILSEHLHKFTCRRIEDYKLVPDPAHIDFNSCFYCIRRLNGE